MIFEVGSSALSHRIRDLDIPYLKVHPLDPFLNLAQTRSFF